MTPREHRLHRLAELREKQHDVSVMHLRAAQSSLRAAETAVSDANATVGAAVTYRNDALRQGSADWLLACAEAELCGVTLKKRDAARASARIAVDAAAIHETEARRERKQMDTTLSRIRREISIASVRAEQRALDEAARIMRAR